VSRGRERATIYTDDKDELLASVTSSEDRMSAIELERIRKAHAYEPERDERRDAPAKVAAYVR